MPFKTLDEFADDDNFHFAATRNTTVPNSPFYRLTERARSGVYRLLFLRKKHIFSPLGNRYSSLYKNIGGNMLIVHTEICDYVQMVYAPHFVQPIRHIIIWERRLSYKKQFPHQELFFKTARKLVEAGLYKKIHSEQLFVAQIIESKPKIEATVNAIQIDVVSILFEVLTAFIVLSCLAFAIEIMVACKHGSNK